MNYIKLNRQGYIRDSQDKASSLQVGGYGCGNHSDMDYVMELKEKINWREFAKVVVRIFDNGSTTTYPSVWQASVAVANERKCKFGSARQEIRKAIKTKSKRYGCFWGFKDGEVVYTQTEIEEIRKLAKADQDAESHRRRYQVNSDKQIQRVRDYQKSHPLSEEKKQQMREKRKMRYRNDPEYRQHILDCCKRYRERKQNNH